MKSKTRSCDNSSLRRPKMEPKEKMNEKINEGALFIVDNRYNLNTIAPYDPTVANQNISFGWQPVPSFESEPTPILTDVREGQF